MKKINEFKGLTGNLKAFKEEVKDAETITFMGVPGACTPFAELFAYAARDKKSCFIPLKDIEGARKFELEKEGMQLAGPANPKSDAIVVLGGVSMPKSNVSLEELKELINKIKKENSKIIGFSDSKLFTNAGWEDKVGFDSLIYVDMIGEFKK